MRTQSYNRDDDCDVVCAPGAILQLSPEQRTISPIARLNTFKINTAICIIASMLVGCASVQPGPNRPVPIDADVAMVSSLAYPQDLATFASGWADKAAARNEMITTRMYVVDMEYQVYEANLTKEMQEEGLAGTATILGLMTSSTLVGAAATKTILSGLATGVTGLDKAYSEKEFMSNAMQSLQTQMRADRKAQAAEIYAKMFRDVGNNVKKPTPIVEYTWTMALADAEAYYWQRNFVNEGHPSSAVGKYQFMPPTLPMLRDHGVVSSEDKLDEPTQDKLAVALMNGRGLKQFLAKTLSAEDFGVNLAMEWAFMPVPKDVIRNTSKGSILVHAGQSYYAGDGLNKSLVPVDKFMDAIRSVLT